MSPNPSNKEYDIYRDSNLRYLGYANEVGEAFRPLVHRNFVNLSYGVAITYLLADCYDKAGKVHRNGGTVPQVATTAGDVFLWQMLASVIIPGFTINRITWITSRAARQLKLKSDLRRTIPTLIGLASIPLIIKPIDHLVDTLMDKTYRKVFKS